MTVKHGILTGMAVVLLAGCGVKSEPERPDPDAFPLTYPRDTNATASDVPGATRQPLSAPTTRRTTGGVYAPPPAATDVPQ